MGELERMGRLSSSLNTFELLQDIVVFRDLFIPIMEQQMAADEQLPKWTKNDPESTKKGTPRGAFLLFVRSEITQDNPFQIESAKSASQTD